MQFREFPHITVDIEGRTATETCRRCGDYRVRDGAEVIMGIGNSFVEAHKDCEDIGSVFSRPYFVER